MIIKLFRCEKCATVYFYGTVNAYASICRQVIGWDTVMCMGKIVPVAQFAAENVTYTETPPPE